MKLLKRRASARRLSGFQRWNIKRTFNVRRRCEFYTDMASFTSEGIAPFHALQRILKVSKPRRSMRWLVNIVEPTAKAMEAGSQSLASAITPWVPPQEVAMLGSAEASGQLSEALVELADLLRVQGEVKEVLIEDLVPAAAKAIAMVLLMVYILKTTMKEAMGLIPPNVFEKLTLAPVYFGFGKFFLASLPYASVIAMVLLVAVVISLPRWKPGKIRTWFDRHVPPYTLVARIQTSFFLL